MASGTYAVPAGRIRPGSDPNSRRTLVAYTPHILVQWGGRLLNPILGADIWTNSVRAHWTNSGGITTMEGYLNEMSPNLKTWFIGANSGMASIATLDFVKANQINAAGHYVDPVTHVRFYPAGTVGGAAPTAPQFTSVVWSWETPIVRGKAAKGRIYPPNFTGTSPEFAGALNAQQQQNNLTSALALLAVIANRDASWITPAIYSESSGEHQDITGVRVGNVMDVQRRRKNAYVENYREASFTA